MQIDVTDEQHSTNKKNPRFKNFSLGFIDQNPVEYFLSCMDLMEILVGWLTLCPFSRVITRHVIPAVYVRAPAAVTVDPSVISCVLYWVSPGINSLVL